MPLWRKKNSVIEARPMPVVFHLETPAGRQHGMPGDYLCKDRDGDEWIMDEGTLRAGWEEEGGAESVRPQALAPPGTLLSVHVYRDGAGNLTSRISQPGRLGREALAAYEEAVCLAEDTLRVTRRALHRGTLPDQDASPETVR